MFCCCAFYDHPFGTTQKTSEGNIKTDINSESMEHLSTTDTFSNSSSCCCCSSSSSPFSVKTNQNMTSFKCPADDRCCYKNSPEIIQRHGLTYVNSDDNLSSKFSLSNHRFLDDDGNSIVRPVSCSIISSNIPLHEDDLSNINVKNLVSFIN